MDFEDENARRIFEMKFRFREEDIVNQIRIGDYDYIFDIIDGRRIIYDDLHESISRVITDRITDVSEEDWKLEFSRKLKNKLAARCIPQKEFAKRIGVNEMTMSRYITGKRIPDSYTMGKIAHALNCDIEYLTNFDYLL